MTQQYMPRNLEAEPAEPIGTKHSLRSRLKNGATEFETAQPRPSATQNDIMIEMGSMGV